MQLTINFNDNDNTLLVVNVDDSSYHYEQLNGDNNVFLKFVTDTYTEIPLGATLQFDQTETAHVAFATDTFRLCVPAKITKISSYQFEIEATFEGTQYSLKKYTMRDLTYNELTQEFSVAGRMKFELTATPREHLERIVANLLWREPDSQWTIGDCIEDTAKVQTFDFTYIWDALVNLAQEYNTEFRIDGHTISLKKVEYDKNDPISLQYGKGNGFKSGVGRVNYGDTMPIEVLNVQGTDRNIDFSKYPSASLPANERSKYLLLPKDVSFLYDDSGCFSFDNGTTWKKWEEDTYDHEMKWIVQSGHTAINAQAYETSDDGLTVQIPAEQQKTMQEGNFDATEIYPSYVCTATNVHEQQGQTQMVYDIVDINIPDALDFEACRLAGEEMTIVFQTGMLAGREFKISKYYHTAGGNKARVFAIVNEEIDGMIMPEPTAFKPAIGDKFVVFGIQLPDAYICDNTTRTGASWDMLRSAVAYLHENKNSKYTFSGELDGIYAKENWSSIGSRMKIGEYVNFTDPNFQSSSVLIRIIGVKQYLCNPYSPEIEMSNDSIGSTLISEMRKAQAQEVTTEVLHQKAIQFSKRSYQDAKDTSDAIQAMVDELDDEFGEFTQGITPAFVQTFQTLVGSDATQFAFGTITRSSSSVPYKFTKQTLNFSYSGHTIALTFNNSYLVHSTLGKTAGEVTSNQGDKAWKVTSWTHDMSALDATKNYYLYAKVKISDEGTVAAPPSTYSNNTFEVSASPISMTYATGYYYLLIGILGAEDENGVRSLAEMYGFTEILPGRITTDKIMSSDTNQGVQIDLVNGTIKGNIVFQSSGTSYNQLQSLISSNTSVKNAQDKFGTCSTTGSTSEKTVTLSQGTLTSLTNGAVVTIDFSNANTAANPTLNVNSKGAKSILSETGSSVGAFSAGTYTLTYNGSAWVMSSATAMSAAASADTRAGSAAAAAVAAAQAAATADGKAVAAQQTADDAALAAQTAQTAVNNIEIGGRNLLPMTAFSFSTGRGLRATYEGDGWVKVTGTLATGEYNEIFAFYKSYTEEAAVAKEGTYIASLVDGTGVISSNIKMCFRQLYSGGTTFKQNKVIGTVNGKLEMDLTGVYISRICLYAEKNLSGVEVDGRFKIKLEKGNRPTDWTPAPEDTDALIAAEAAAQTAALEALGQSVAGDISNLQSQIDGQIMTWFDDYVPTLSNLPASGWSAAEKANHLGDLFYDNTTGYCYRFANSGTSQSPVYEWLRITDTDVTKALEDAAKAQATADKKMRIFTATPTPPYDKGDMWAQGSGGDILYCNTAKAEGASYSASDWVSASKYTDDTQANLAMAEAKYSAIKTATCSTAASTQTKTVTLPDDTSMRSTLKAGDSIVVTFTNTNTAASPKFQIGSRTAYNLIVEVGVAFNKDTDSWAAGDTYTLTLVSVSNTLYWLINGLADIRDTKAAIATMGSELQAQIDSKIETWVQATDPSTDWTTTALKDAHVGDLWQYTGTTTNSLTNSSTYKYTKSGSTYSWTAYAANSYLFDKIDGKTTIYYGSTSGSYPNKQVGDFLFDNTTGNEGKSYRWSGSAWVTVQDYQAAIANIQIGGRNLLLNSSLTENLDNWSTTGGAGTFVTEDGRKCYKIVGAKSTTKTFGQSVLWAIKDDTPSTQHYMMSGFCKLSNYSAGTTNPFVCPCYFGGAYNNGGTSTLLGANYHKFWINGVDQNITNSGDSIVTKIVAKNNAGWFYFVLEFSVPQVPTSLSNSNYMRDCTGTLFVCNLKLEKGNKATQWSPAPEDLEAEAAAAQSRADAAYTQAENANADLTKYASDSYISPSEKHALQQQWADIQKEYTNVCNDADKYSVTRTAYNTAYNKVATAMGYFLGTASGAPAWTEHVSIASGTGATYYAYISAYYAARQTLLDSIATAAKNYANTAAATAVNNLEIGGTNLLRTTEVWEQGTWNSSTGAHSSSTTRIRCTKDGAYINVVAGKTYTISRYTDAGASKTYEVVLYAYDSQGNFESADSKVGWQSTYPFQWTPATAVRLEIGIRHTDNSTITVDEAAIAKIKIEQGNKPTAWSPAPEDVEAEIGAVADRIANIDSDSVFSVSEKQNFRVEFEQIVGATIDTAASPSVPDASTIIANANNKYSNGSFLKHYKLINSTAANTLGALSTAYNNLRSFLIGSTAKLYTNEDTDDFSRGTLATYLAAYYKAESDIEFYAENVGAVVASSSTAAGYRTKIVPIAADYVSATMLADMLADADFRCTITFTNENTSTAVDFKFQVNGSDVTPKNVSYATCLFQYNGTTSGNQKCFWPEGTPIEIKQVSKSTTYVTFGAVDEPNLKQFVLMNKAMAAGGGVFGGLALLSYIAMRNSQLDEVAGINGQEDSDVAFWAGGTLAQAIADATNVWIKYTGAARFGVLHIDDAGNISMPIGGFSRLNILSSALPDTTVNEWTYNNYTKTGGTMAAGTTSLVTNLDPVYVDRSSYNGMLVECNGIGYIGIKASQNTVMGEFRIVLWAGSNSVTLGKVSAGKNLTTEYQYFDISAFAATIPYMYNSSTPSIKLVFETDSNAAAITFSFFSSSVGATQGNYGLYGRWGQDNTKAVTNFANDGLLVMLKSNNFFEVKEYNGALRTTIKGEQNIAGVIWSGTIKGSNGEVDKRWSINGVRLDFDAHSNAGVYQFILTGVTRTPTVLANVINTTGGNGWTANIAGCTTVGNQTTIKIRVFEDNTLKDAGFHLVIIGSNL